MDRLTHMVHSLYRQLDRLRQPSSGKQAGTLFSSSSLLKVDVVKVRRARLFSKQTCDALPNRGQVQSNPCGLLDSKLTCWSMGLAYIRTVVIAGRIGWLNS
jgi:hypothetical protein